VVPPPGDEPTADGGGDPTASPDGGSGSESDNGGGGGATDASPPVGDGPARETDPPAPAPAPAEASLERTATPSSSPLDAAKSGLEPAIAAVEPALAPLFSSAPSNTTTPSFGTPTFGGAAPSIVAQRVLRRWFAPHALLVLAHDVMPGVHSIRARLGRRNGTFAVSFGRAVATIAARRPFTAGGWLRSDASGVTVCIRAIESYRHRTIRASETCSVAHRNWRHVALESRTVARGHRIAVSVYELGASPGDSFDVGGFRVSQR
jgi:hypothetical protein